ncbi:DUF5916 domain-containing protein [Leadbetterella sp. DM7]|uniref:DUF5916 domain-containing protein n=1 Tax=Leadbetterella sp. DM7 TaxID=3235085 RepID=UPI00349E856D
MYHRFLLVILFFLPFITTGYAQKPNEHYKYFIKRAVSPVKVDAIDDEETWALAQTAENFFMITPVDTGYARAVTRVKMAYDDNNLYILAVNYKEIPGSFIVESMKRDFVFGKNDNFLMTIDPFDDRTNGYVFGANAAGAPWDAQQADGGTADTGWENRWVSAVKNYEDKWVWEAAIPFKSIRYKTGASPWGLNFSRLDVSISEKSSWAPVPRQMPSVSLAYTGMLVWDADRPSPGTNISVIPYTAMKVIKDYQAPGGTRNKLSVGGDIKIGLTPSLNLDLTVNPDFSQVDVDVQQTNIDRFELFFPERRQFFLENADLFANFGYATLRPFFSRRIGLDAPIQFGGKISGKINRNWRVGVLNVQTGASDSLLPNYNYSVIALQRRLFSRSNIRLILVNKDATHYVAEQHHAASRFNRNAGLEFNLASKNNLWTGKMMFLKSFAPNTSSDDISYAADLKFNKTRMVWQWQHEYVGKNYLAEVGYVPNAVRNGYYKISPNISYLFFVKSPKLISHGPKLLTNIYWNKAFENTDQEYILSYNVNFRNLATASLWASSNYVRLTRPFDPTNLAIAFLPAGSEHRWHTTGLDLVSSPQNLFIYSLSTSVGSYYQNGQRDNVKTEIGYRFQPRVLSSIATNYNHIRLPDPWNNTHLWLVGPRVDVTFTNSLYFSALAQYNNQAKNINLNTRVQWRYKPASDLFIVYTDNYLPENFKVKNRAIVLKLTYWWNL